ncbi:MAG: hypothetical protein P4L43_01210 [Syntrophobacteraceae bacterium]|nr:hypothetical protein [Syntrophobacteraceae bacterium]
MKIKTAWAIRSLALCIFFNLAFTAVVIYMAGRVIDASHQWVCALGASGAPVLSAKALEAVGGLKALIAQTRGRLTGVLCVLSLAFTLLLWFFIFLTGARQIEIQESRGDCVKLEVGPAKSDCVSEIG